MMHKLVESHFRVLVCQFLANVNCVLPSFALSWKLFQCEESMHTIRQYQDIAGSVGIAFLCDGNETVAASQGLP
jgi:hypothetical protein